MGPAGAEILAETLRLYHGVFLPDDTTPYTLIARERLRDKFLRGVERIGIEIYGDFIDLCNNALNMW